MPRSSMRSACSGSAGAGSTRQRGAVREPGGELGRRGDGAAGDAQQRVRHGDVRRRDLGGVARREREVEHEGALARSRERDGAGGRAHAAAGAEQRDVALVVGRRAAGARVEAARRGQRVAQRRSVERPLDDARPRRSRAPAAPRSPTPARGDQQHARVRAAGALAAHEVAARPRATSRRPAACRRRPSARAPAVRSPAGPRAARAAPRRARRRRRAARAGRSRAARRAAAAAARAPRRPVASASATAAGARTVTEMPPERSLAGDEQLESARSDARAVGPTTITTSTKRPALQQPQRRAPSAGASSSATARSPRRSSDGPSPARSAPRSEEVAAGEARSACGARPARRAGVEHRRRAIGGRDRHRDDIAVARTISPGGHACRSASTAVCGSPLPGSSPSTSASEREREARRGQPVLAQPLERGRSGSRDDRPGRRQRQAQREARAPPSRDARR